MPIGNALLIAGLHSEVPKFTSTVSPDAVVLNGALNLQSLTTSPSILHGLREAYAIAISHVNFFLVATIVISVPTALGMEWLNIKRVSMQREENKRWKAASEDAPEQQHGLSVNEK